MAGHFVKERKARYALEIHDELPITRDEINS